MTSSECKPSLQHPKKSAYPSLERLGCPSKSARKLPPRVSTQVTLALPYQLDQCGQAYGCTALVLLGFRAADMPSNVLDEMLRYWQSKKPHKIQGIQEPRIQI